MRQHESFTSIATSIEDDVEIILNLLKKAPPMVGLITLFKMREAKISEKITFLSGLDVEARDKNFVNKLGLGLEIPVNPLLMATAISVAIVRGCDFLTFIQNYVEGVEIPDFEDTLIKLEDFQDQSELQEILEFESQYVDAFISIGQATNEDDPSLFVDNDYQTVWDDYEAAWVIANPMGSQLPSWNTRWLNYGQRINNDVHNAKDYYNYQLADISKQINELLSKPLPSQQKKEELEQLGLKHSNTAKLITRLDRLYYWNPHEILAFREQTISLLDYVVKNYVKASNFETIKYRLGFRRVLPPSFNEDVRRAFQRNINSAGILERVILRRRVDRLGW